MASADTSPSPLALLGQRLGIAGLVVYSVFAPHSIAASSIGIALSMLGWAIRSIATGSLRLRRSAFDLPILLFCVWTGLSSLLSAEPRISLLKLRSLWCILIFYLVRSIVTRRVAMTLVVLLIISGIAGVLFSVYDLARGRGVVVTSITTSSPFSSVGVEPGDVIWRVARRRIYSLPELDSALKSLPPGIPFSVSIISQGEHVERPGVVLTPGQQTSSSPSGITGNETSHRFRASGWTRHYETFAELLLLIGQLAFGIALTNFRNHGLNVRFRVALIATILLTIGVALTAMRTVMIAMVLAASLIAWRALRGASKVVFTFGVFFILAFGAVVVWQTRAQTALELGDPSSNLRLEVARVGLSRLMQHPVFGHGMDAMQKHWTEWGFPGHEMVHLHSTPLQLAFDRGLPALLIWLWLMGSVWLHLSACERVSRESSDTNFSGVLLGALGAVTGFLVSSLVNYNFGDGEVGMLLFWIIGIAMVICDELPPANTMEPV